MADHSSYEKDFKLAQAAIAGDSDAASPIESEYRPMLIRVLVARGLPSTDAEDISADIIAECFGGKKGESAAEPLLAKFEGRSALSTWLIRAAWNRWLDLKRRDKFKGELPGSYEPDYEERGDAFDRIAGEEEHDLDSDLATLMTEAIKNAFASLEPETLLLMKLVYLHKVGQESVARTFG